MAKSSFWPLVKVIGGLCVLAVLILAKSAAPVFRNLKLENEGENPLPAAYPQSATTVRQQTATAITVASGKKTVAPTARQSAIIKTLDDFRDLLPEVEPRTIIFNDEEDYRVNFDKRSGSLAKGIQYYPNSLVTKKSVGGKVNVSVGARVDVDLPADTSMQAAIDRAKEALKKCHGRLVEEYLIVVVGRKYWSQEKLPPEQRPKSEKELVIRFYDDDAAFNSVPKEQKELEKKLDELLWDYIAGCFVMRNAPNGQIRIECNVDKGMTAAVDLPAATPLQVAIDRAKEMAKEYKKERIIVIGRKYWPEEKLPPEQRPKAEKDLAVRYYDDKESYTADANDNKSAEKKANGMVKDFAVGCFVIRSATDGEIGVKCIGEMGATIGEVLPASTSLRAAVDRAKEMAKQYKKERIIVIGVKYWP